jgi:hypothetical protein
MIRGGLLVALAVDPARADDRDLFNNVRVLHHACTALRVRQCGNNRTASARMALPFGVAISRTIE